MESTGRIKQAVAPLARHILFERNFEQQIADELEIIARIDCAHLVMLMEAGIVSREDAAQLLTAIRELEAQGFRPINGLRPSRGLFLAYEDYLIEHQGRRVGGVLQTARSRNDLNATLARIQLRKPLIELWKEILKLQTVLLRRARRYAGTVMPAYTHYQPAVPITLLPSGQNR